MNQKPSLILGSASPRRKELLTPHFRLTVLKPEIDESPRRGEKALAYVRRMARSKWQALAETTNARPLVTADTIVVYKGKILGKPTDRKDAERMLRLLSGKVHEVITAVCIGEANHRKIFHVTTKIRFRNISRRELVLYLDGKEWDGKAGAYAIQGKASHFVAEIRGSLTNVIGLPLERILALTKMA